MSKPATFSHGRRPSKTGRVRKGADDYALENQEDLIVHPIIRNGGEIRVLVCRFCCTSVGARSDRIKEHLNSKRHKKLKLATLSGDHQTVKNLTLQRRSVSCILPESFKVNFSPEAFLSPNGVLSDQGFPVAKIPKMENQHQSGLRFHEPEDPQDQAAPASDGVSEESSSMTSEIGGDISMEESNRSSEGSDSPISENNESQQSFCIRHVHFPSSIISRMSQFRNRQDFVDVTLSCEGKTIKCHRLVLCAGSMYFEKILGANREDNHPIIFLVDYRFWEIQALVDFMYEGVVNVEKDKLPELLNAAESLQIEGLFLRSSSDDKE